MYRFPEVPASEQDEYLEALLLVGRGAMVSHESALGLLELADVNPRTVHVTVPPLAVRDTTREDGIPAVTAARAIRDGLVGGTDSRLLAQAIAGGRRQGYLTAIEAAALEGALDARAGVGGR